MEKTKAARRYTDIELARAVDNAVAVERQRWVRLLADAIAFGRGEIDAAELRQRTRAAA